METLLSNALEFLESGEDNFLKKRYNAATSDFFKSIVVFCDYLIYSESKRLPKNNSDRFALLEIYFPKVYLKVSKLFKPYTSSYNFKCEKEDVLVFREYARELEEFIRNKEKA